MEIPALNAVSREEAEIYSCELRQHNTKDAIAGWNQAIEKLQSFRQGVNLGRNHKKDNTGQPEYYDKQKKFPKQGRSRWPEPDSLREIHNTFSPQHEPTHIARPAFPRAVFGLPIIFKFKDDKNGDPSQSELRPAHSERMASPLILKPMATNQGYKAIALLLPDTALKNLKLQLHGIPEKPERLTPKKENEWKEKDWEKWPENWWNEDKAEKVKPIHNRGTDALSAFLDFFGGQ